jgi:hypothetical protein
LMWCLALLYEVTRSSTALMSVLGESIPNSSKLLTVCSMSRIVRAIKSNYVSLFFFIFYGTKVFSSLSDSRS